MHEPEIKDPEQAFLAAVSLAENDGFQRARRGLFDWEDALYVDGWEPAEAEKRLLGLEEECRDAVRASARRTRTRYVATLLPKAAGSGAVAAGDPQAEGIVSKWLSFVAGRFFPAWRADDREAHPGAALEISAPRTGTRIPKTAKAGVTYSVICADNNGSLRHAVAGQTS